MKLAYMPILYRYPAAEHVMSTIQLVDHCRREGVPLYYRAMRGDALIERTRGRAATSFLLNTSYDVMLQVDDDIAFSPADALKVAELAMTHGVAVGVYLTRHRTAGIPTSYLEPGSTSRFFQGEQPFPVRWGGGGFMAVHRDVLKRLVEDLPLCHPGEDLEHYPLYQTMVVEDPLTPGRPILLSEDWAFCERARRVGYTTYADPNVRLTHFGGTAFTIEDMLGAAIERQEITIEHHPDGEMTVIGGAGGRAG